MNNKKQNLRKETKGGASNFKNEVQFNADGKKEKKKEKKEKKREKRLRKRNTERNLKSTTSAEWNSGA